MAAQSLSSYSPFSITCDTDVDEIDQMLNVMNTKAVISESKGYDILQQAIICCNETVVSYLLMRKIPLPTYHPICNEYLHLACKLDRHVMVKKIIEARPEDFFYKGRACYPNPCYHCTEETISKEPSSFATFGLLPLEIVVTRNKIDCLLALLHYVPSGAQSNLTPAAFLCDINNPAALGLLLKTAVTLDDLQVAYRQALIKKRHRCLELLLTHGHGEVCVSGMNPFHILYQYSSGYNRHSTRHEGLTATTQVLLTAGVDISTHVPAGSYPLYSLIELMMKDVGSYGEEYVSDSTNELISCLKLILKQGVRIDLDEVHISLSSANADAPVAFGRDRFCSAFDVLSVNAAGLLGINLAASEIIKTCVDILLEYRGDRVLKPSYLTGILKLMARGRRSKSIQKNLESVVYQYLCHGINTSLPIPQPYGVTCAHMLLYPLNKYVEALCAREDDSDSFSPKQTLNDNPVIRWLINTMKYNAICSANQINYRILSTLSSSALTPSLIRLITNPPLLRLKTLAARSIWFSIERRREKLKVLPIPNGLKSSFVDIIIKEI